jgi:hypothetical protein
VRDRAGVLQCSDVYVLPNLATEFGGLPWAGEGTDFDPCDWRLEQFLWV